MALAGAAATLSFFGVAHALTSDATQLTVTIARAFSLTAPSGPTSFGSVAQGESASEPTPLRVFSNVPSGYAITISRTSFSGGDLPLSIVVPAPGAAGQTLDIVAGTATPIPVGSAKQFGHRTGTITLAAGDLWNARLLLGPVPCKEKVKPPDRSGSVTVRATAAGAPTLTRQFTVRATVVNAKGRCP